MTGAIIYTSEEDFDTDLKQDIISDMKSLAEEHRWWNQPISFADHPDYPDALDGSTELVHRYFQSPNGQQRKIDYKDDILMGMVDYAFIIGILAAASKEHEFSWNLCYPAHPRPKQIGMIREGEIEARVFDFLLQEMQALDISDADLENEKLHSEIRSKYFTPEGEKIYT